MSSFNKVILMGNLTRDPQLSYLPSGKAVCAFGLAVNNRWRDKDGQQREETCFVDCQTFGPQAEAAGKYLRKGSPVLVEGRLKLNMWETPDGQKRQKHSIDVTVCQFLAKTEKDQKPAPAEQQAATAAQEHHDADGDPKDIPF